LAVVLDQLSFLYDFKVVSYSRIELNTLRSLSYKFEALVLSFNSV